MAGDALTPVDADVRTQGFQRRGSRIDAAIRDAIDLGDTT